MSNYRFLSVISLVLLLAMLSGGCTVGGSEGATANSDATASAEAATAVALTAEEETRAAQAAQEQLETAVALTVSAQSEATAAAVATQTSAAATAAGATAEAATAEAEAAEAATATHIAQATATAVALITARAEMAAEATVAFVAQQEDSIQEAQSGPPIYGPINADLPHVEDEFMEVHFADVNVRNFVAEATFILDPSAGQIGNRDFGFLFRNQDEEAWCLTVKRSGEWELIRYGADSADTEESGRMATGIAGASNTLTLYVNESEGAFFVNGEFISVLPLANGPDMGEIAAVIGAFNNSERDGEITLVEDFTVWLVGEMPPTPTPAPVTTAAPRATAPPPGFDATALMNSLNTMRLTIEHMGGLLDRLYHGEAQSCGEFLGYYQALQQRTTHSNLPTAWQGIYSEYNFAAENILNTNTSIKTLCEGGGGYISDLDYGVARQGIGLSLDRINQAIQAANNLLNQ